LEAKSTEDVEGLKSQMHIAEVDLNYTQYHPLAETYISLYPQKKDGEENSKADDTQTKPPIWAEVERCMEKGTLDRLRNRSIAPTPVPRKLVVRTAKAKKAPASVDTSGMNRRQRRKQSGISGVKEPSKTKHKSTGFERNQLFGASEGAKQTQDDGSDGGFFEE